MICRPNGSLFGTPHYIWVHFRGNVLIWVTNYILPSSPKQGFNTPPTPDPPSPGKIWSSNPPPLSQVTASHLNIGYPYISSTDASFHLYGCLIFKWVAETWLHDTAPASKEHDPFMQSGPCTVSDYSSRLDVLTDKADTTYVMYLRRYYM